MHRLLANWLAPGVMTLFTVTACTPSPQGPAPDTQPQSKVVAWVDGSPITEDDVTRSIVNTFGPGAYANLTDENRKTVLESLILSRAVSLQAEPELSAADRATLEADVRYFREQELVKLYLKRHARPQPITEAMVRAYYEEHPERFGGGSLKIFEMLAGPAGLAGVDRTRAIEALGAADRREDWAAYADSLRISGIAVRYSRGELKEALLDARLVKAVDPLEVGQASPITFVDGVPYALRIVAEQVQKPRPLQEVRTDIRKALLPLQLKEAISSVSGEVMAGVEVRYAEDGTQ